MRLRTLEVYSVELVEANAEISRHIWAHASVDDRVTCVVGTIGGGGSTLDVLAAHGFEASALDLLFLDHDKAAYLDDLHTITDRGWLHPGSIVVADNICQTRPDDCTVRDVWSLPRRAAPPTSVAVAVAVLAAILSGCGSGDSTVAKTPQATATTSGPTSGASNSAPSGPSLGAVQPPSSSVAPADPCAVNLSSPTIAKVVSELPRDPRSEQPWNPEPLAGNYNECAQLSAVVIKANTNTTNPTTRAVMFHLGKYIPQGVPDTYGFNGIDTLQCTGDTVALTYPSGISGLNSNVKFRWNGNGVELISNTTGS